MGILPLFAATSAVWLIAASFPVIGPTGPYEAALHFFEGHEAETIDGFLRRHRPLPLAVALVSPARDGLPPDMTPIPPDGRLAEKTVIAERVLAFSQRSGTIQIAVIPSDIAYAALYSRALLLISTTTVEILNADELAAVVAHEVSHDYDWDRYWAAISRRDFAQLQALELRSDGYAVLTLEAMRIPPGRLVSAATKMMRRNVRNLPVGQTLEDQGTGSRYVPLEQRIQFIRAVAKLRWNGR